MRYRIPALALAFLAACQGYSPSTADTDLVLAIHAGTAQEAIAGTNVAEPPAVLVTRRGSPVAGVTVQFRVSAGGGSLQGATAVTGPDGIARVEGWTLGPAGQQAVEATVADAVGSPIYFTATSTTSNPVAVAPLQGGMITGTVGLPVTVRPVLRVTDGAGRPIPGVMVDWQIGSGGGGMRYGDAVTDRDGTAGVLKWVLGTTAGENTLIATVHCEGRCAPVVFRAIGEAGAVTEIVRVAGNGQSAPAGSAVTTPPSVRLSDAYGNAVADRPVTFEVTGGGGSITGGQATSNGDGVATIGSWTLGPGHNVLQVTAEGVTVVFTATGT